MSDDLFEGRFDKHVTDIKLDEELPWLVTATGRFDEMWCDTNKDLGNRDGNFICRPFVGSDDFVGFRETAKNIRMEENDGAYWLIADLKADDGSYRESRVCLSTFMRIEDYDFFWDRRLGSCSGVEPWTTPEYLQKIGVPDYNDF